MVCQLHEKLQVLVGERYFVGVPKEDHYSYRLIAKEEWNGEKTWICNQVLFVCSDPVRHVGGQLCRDDQRAAAAGDIEQ